MSTCSQTGIPESVDVLLFIIHKSHWVIPSDLHENASGNSVFNYSIMYLSPMPMYTQAAESGITQ